MTEKFPPALRISQLDACELDSNVIQLLTSQLQACLKHKVAGKSLLNAEPHIRVLIYGALLYKTLWKSRVSIGQKLLAVRYACGADFGELPPRKCAAVVTALVLSFCWKVFSGFPARYRSLKVIESGTSRYHSLLTLLNWLAFLRQGHYPSLMERLLGIRTVFSEPTFERAITFHTMEREVLWHGYANALMLLTSLVNVNKVWYKVRKLLFQSKISSSLRGGSSDGSRCGFCDRVPCTPCLAACQVHSYCYYCASVALALDARATCPTCNIQMAALHPLPYVGTRPSA